MVKESDYKGALDKIRANPVTGTKKIADEMKAPAAADYIRNCLEQFYGGHYGITPLEDVQANIYELVNGEGRIIGRYSAGGVLSSDIFIIAYFSEHCEDVDYNYTTILHCKDY